MRHTSLISCPSNPIFEAVEDDLTTSKFYQQLPLHLSGPNLEAAIKFF